MTLSVPLLSLASMPSVSRWASVQQGPGYHDWPMGPGMMSPWGMGWMGMFFMLVFWILVIVGLFLLIRWLLQATAGKRQEQREPRSVDSCGGDEVRPPGRRKGSGQPTTATTWGRILTKA